MLFGIFADESGYHREQLVGAHLLPLPTQLVKERRRDGPNLDGVLGTDGAGAGVGWLPAHQKTLQARLAHSWSADHKGDEIVEQDVALL